MLKKILLITAAVLLGGYLVFALLFLTPGYDEEQCKGVEIFMEEEQEVLTVQNVENIIKSKKLDPTGKPMKDVDCAVIEKAIKEYSLVEACECYKTHKGLVGIRVRNKMPIMQVFDENGKEFFIDDSGCIIEGVQNALYLPIASGHIEPSMADGELLAVARFLQGDRFWNQQIEQVYFTPKKEVVLIPRVGNHTIELGMVENLDGKFEKLKEFYEKGLNEIGWNKYKKLNIEFKDKVIGTKK